MNPCNEVDCVGHQPAIVPDFIEYEGEVIEVRDVATDDYLNCWECGLNPPAPLSLYDDVMAGEILCEPCATRLKAHLRIDDGGDKF